MTLAGRISAGLIAFGFLGGIVFDPRPSRPEVRRAGYRVLEGDFHAHTTFSDGSLTPMGVVRQADRRGLDVLGVTEHNTVIAAKLARGWSNAFGGPLVIVGEEVTTKRFHIIGLGLTSTIEPHREAKEVISDIHAQGGYAIAAHPVASFWPALLPVRDQIDGAEVMHPVAFGGRSGGWRWSEAIRYYEEDKHLGAIGSSDYHWGSVLGVCRTLLFVTDATDKGVMEALHAKRTVTIGVDGHLYGPRDLTEALEREPYTPRTSDYAYHGEGVLDRILRTLGWLGVVALVVLGKRRPSPPEEALEIPQKIRRAEGPEA